MVIGDNIESDGGYGVDSDDSPAEVDGEERAYSEDGVIFDFAIASGLKG